MMKTILDCIKDLPTSPIDWYWYSGYHDRPLSGWLRVDGRRYYYQILGEADHWYTLYGVYNVPKTQRIPHMIKHRRWRQIMGWHNDRAPGQPRGDLKACGVEGIKAVFEAYKKSIAELSTDPLNITNMEMRGISNLHEVAWMVHSEYDKCDLDEVDL